MPLQLELREIAIPFRFRYGHAQKQHQSLSAVVCLAAADDGAWGLGEAVPRSYVTGESCDSIFDSLAAVVRQIDIGSDLSERQRQRCELARHWSGPFPSCTFCAIDTALESLWAHRHQQALAESLGGSLPQRLSYTASIGMGKTPKLLATLLAYRALGWKHFKVKVGDDEDEARIRWIFRILGRDISLFADANAIWTPETTIRKMEQFAQLGVWALEEPLRPSVEPRRVQNMMDREAILDDSHYERYRWLRTRSPLPLIADESLISMRTAEKIIEHQAFDLFNIRLSKCGGPLLAARMVQMAREAQLEFSIGAMVGETPILALAGAEFGAAFPDHRYLQGFSHRLLHRHQFAHGEPGFRRGTLEVPAGPGLPLTLDRSALDRLTVRIERLQT